MNVDIGGGPATIVLLELVDGRECLGKLNRCEERGAWR